MFSFQKEFLLDEKEQLANHRREIDAKLLSALPKGKTFSPWLTSVLVIEVSCDWIFFENSSTAVQLVFSYVSVSAYTKNEPQWKLHSSYIFNAHLSTCSFPCILGILEFSLEAE